jgi:hypothetical protein
MPQIHIVNPIEIPDWDAQVLAFPQATVFHSAAWARVLIESYGFKPHYCVKSDGKALTAILPLMEVRDVLGRKKAVCLPFSDFCAPLYNEPADFIEIFTNAKDAARGRKWRSITLRGNCPFPEDTPTSTSYYRHILRLNADPDSLLKNFRENTRRNIRKATKCGVTVEFDTSLDAVREFDRLNCLTRKRHGLPPQPMFFFAKLHELIIARGKGRIALARRNNTVVAAFVFFEFGQTAFYKYGASDDRYNDACANYAIMGEAIRTYAGQGHTEFCFGRTEPHHRGLLQFKTGWNATQYLINNYQFDLGKNAFCKSELSTTGSHNRIFMRMPLPILRLVGRLLYKYMG